MDVCLLFLVEICKQQAYFVNFDFDLFTEQSTKVEAQLLLKSSQDKSYQEFSEDLSEYLISDLLAFKLVSGEAVGAWSSWLR